ncbi:MAG TPA: ankyrin repeat domain-containing protein [Blastocatellia bacterium]|nr:ankyrin repeat domain-containing protein [Blastocatellia bacterium]
MADIYDNLKNTPLIEAVKSGQLSEIRQLIESGADVNQPGEQGWTPLNWAAGRGDLEAVRLLVENGADIFKVGRDQRTPYLIALAAGHAEVVIYLRKAEDNVEGDKPVRPERKYCKAYYLKDLRQFPNWSESRINWKEKKQTGKTADRRNESPVSPDKEIAFLHQDYTVTQSMWHDESIIFNEVTSEWKEFCTSVLKFRVPDDLDLIVSAKSASGGVS